jgi:hypothetical protein
MLLIILLGAIAQLVAVSADCDIGAVDTSHSRPINVSYSVMERIMIDVDMCENK